jgi:uncharacterized protein YndB with AHSA1/START domain
MKNEIVQEIWIAAERERVFAALTTREGIDAWWGTAVRADPVRGSVIELDHNLGAPLLMEITDLVPDERVTWRCVSSFDDPSNPASEWHDTRLTFDLAPRQPVELLGRKLDVTVLHFTHAGWPDGARWRGFCNAAWGATLNGNLKTYCEEDA